MKIKLLLAAVSLVGLALPLRSAPLNESTFTEVVKDVNVISGADKTTVPATINNLFKSPDIVRTGPDSRAEMTSADQTVIRVGANSVFSFEAAGRNLDLEQGSVLFHPPAGAGGGTIKSGGSAAAVLGTTLIVTATRDGGFKVIMLEGKGTVTLSDGKSVTLKAGQMVFVLPGGTTFSSVLDINLEKLAANSQLIHGFSHELSSLLLIQKAIDAQNAAIASGQTVDTGILADQFINPPGQGNGFGSLDPGSYQVAAPQPLSGLQSGNPGGRGFTSENGPVSTPPSAPVGKQFGGP